VSSEYAGVSEVWERLAGRIREAFDARGLDRSLIARYQQTGLLLERLGVPDSVCARIEKEIEDLRVDGFGSAAGPILTLAGAVQCADLLLDVDPYFRGVGSLTTALKLERDVITGELQPVDTTEAR
jgi:hypothetical protein